MASTAGSTAVDTQVSGPQNGGISQRFSDFCTFLYNSEEGKVLGRTGKSWAGIGVFYTIYYICLAGFFAGMLAVFYTTLDWNKPRLQGSDSLLKQNPGLAFRPLPDVSTTLIRFNKARASTYTPYVDHIAAFLQYYENELQTAETGTIVDCDTYTKLRDEDQWDKACRFDITNELGDVCVKQQSFGYEDGQPCVLLKLNRIFDWLPEPFESNSSIPSELQGSDIWQQYSITVKCEGENPADNDKLGDILYYPPHGFHFKYFPYRNQQGYRSPLVFVRFDNPEPAQLFMITCKVYAKNIEYDFMDRSGLVHFELMVD
ncbi:AT1B1-like protein [Mya arenaria]|uniref:AT1B1-like protein n=1 Tax=Mya arenaria TaxID=6604 RepID=A0ABY7G2Q9_MYAAR|nr:sodium/potassium-transporting ATPase subunit beta-like [Mya arenaria]WAR28728.1 AT1B1-like protein [Mya arenaria]